MELVQGLTPETITTDLLSIPSETEDVLLTITTLLNAESMVDQTIMTSAPKLMLSAQEHCGYHTTLELDLNSESPEKVGLKDFTEEFGDH
jgi:hypothetical protein